MRFLILGATGPSGILIVRKTLQVYPDASIVIFARSPQKVPEDLAQNSAITLIKGEFKDLDALSTAVEGVDVVFSALGPSANHPAGNIIATFYGHLIDLMNKYNVKRIILLGTASITDSKDKPSWIFKLLVAGVRLAAHTAYLDIVAVGEVIRTRGDALDWTIVRVPLLTDRESEGVVAGHIGDGKTGTHLSRKAYAAFTVHEVEKREWVKEAPLISSP
ncbi:NAD(P)-binding protein [Phlegmacium glaucopus]|nr:NAD(P)-binding protein [Phlegmacium glaucopus]